MKTFSLILSLVLILIYAIFGTLTEYGLYEGCPTENRLTYLFIHGGVGHVLVNCYCLLTLAFLCGLRWWQFLVATIIAMTCVTSTDIPVVGISTLIYACTGLVVMESKNWWWLTLMNLLFIGASAALSGIAFLQHLTCFGAGLGVGFLFGKRYEE